MTATSDIPTNALMDDLPLIAGVAVSSAVYSVDKPYDYVVPADMAGVAAVGQRVNVPFGRSNRTTNGFIISLRRAEAKSGLKYISHVFDDMVVLSGEDISLSLWMCKRYFCTFFEAASALLPPGMWSRDSEVYSPGDMTLEQALAAGGKGKKRLIIQEVYSSEKPITEGELCKACQLVNIRKYTNSLVKDKVIAVSQTFSRGIKDKLIWQVSLAMPVEQARAQLGSGVMAERRRAVVECVAQADTLPEKELCYLTGVSAAVVRRLSDIGILRREQAEVYRRPKVKKADVSAEIELNEYQQAAYEGIIAMLPGGAQAALLEGVTGSGKTQVYIKLITDVLAAGKTAILLVPEIALTPQMVRMFYSCFGDVVAVVHSGLTFSQRYDEYKRIRSGVAKVVVGTRTAVFAPISDIGIIIIDEEQEYSYKSDADPRYNAKDIAKHRAVKHSCLLLLGSATPSVESYYSAQSGKYRLFQIPERYNDVPLPQTIISDMRSRLRDGDDSLLGAELMRELRLNIERSEQSILFINRRGSSRMAMCVDCGHIPQCENCSVSLTYHSKNTRLMCHHCGHSTEMITTCPQCGGPHIKLVGAGTQKVEEELLTRLPGCRVIRMDADTIVERVSHEKLLDSFAEGAADILLGTQMVAKGLDFDNVTLVGVLDADLSLYVGDYHASERTFSLIAQVVGRAGRRQKPGRAIIQTFTPQNPIILAAARQDYADFYRYEIDLRRALQAPPFCDMFVFTLSGPAEEETLRGAQSLAATLRRAFEGECAALGVPVLGPAPAAIAKLNRRYRFTVSFRGKDSREYRELISKMMAAFYRSPYSKSVSIAADMNPFNA